jgi:hypothetical protein
MQLPTRIQKSKRGVDRSGVHTAVTEWQQSHDFALLRDSGLENFFAALEELDC